MFALVLVVTSVFMTQKPPWMEGKEADLGISSPFIAPGSGSSTAPYAYTDAQMGDMAKQEPVEDGEDEEEDGGVQEKGRPQTLVQMQGRGRGRMRLSGKAAVEAAAHHPGGLLHGDDAYVRVGTGQVLTARQRVHAAQRAQQREVQQLRQMQRGRVAMVVGHKGNDEMVSVKQMKSETYPLMNLASETSNGEEPSHGEDQPAHEHGEETPNTLFAKALNESKAGDGEYIDTVDGSTVGEPPRLLPGYHSELLVSASQQNGSEEPPLSRLGGAVAGAGYSDEAAPVDAAKSATWAYYGAIFIVLVGSSLLLLYYMLPKGAVARALKGDLGVYDQFKEEGGVVAAGRGAEQSEAWRKGFSAAEAGAEAEAGGVRMPVRVQTQIV